MSNYAYTKLYPVSGDVDAVATQLAQRQSDSGTNAGIADNGNPALGQLAQGGPNDPAGVGTAFFAAQADVILCSVGFQLESNSFLSAHNTSSTTYADVPGTSITFSAPVAKTYVVHADFSWFFSAGTDPLAFARLVVNGSAGPELNLNAITANVTAATQFTTHLMHAAACAAGNNTIKLQWRVNNAAFTLNVTNASYSNYIISG